MSSVRNGLTARSVLLSVLLGTTPPRLPVQVLVRTTDLFGIAEGTTRTALSRMAAAGEVEAQGGWYALTADRLLARQARQAVSRSAVTEQRWDGGWVQAVVSARGPRAAADRAALRSTLNAARLAELREGVWLRPDNLGGLPETSDDAVRWFRSFPEDNAITLAEQLWDLEAWAESAVRLRAEMRALLGPLEAGDRAVLREGFVLSAAVLRQFQSDPLLPAALLPTDWPGGELREDYDRYDTAYRALLRSWLSDQ